MSPDDLQAEQIRRLEQDVRDLREERIRETAILHARIDKAESRVGTLVMVLVGFAFTVAGSALALALSLGSPS